MRRALVLSLSALSLSALGTLLAGCSGESAQLPAGASASPTDPGSESPGAPVTADGSVSVSGPGLVDGGAPGTDPDAGAEGPWPGSQVFFFAFPPQKQAARASWGTALTDIIRHLHPTYGTQYDYPQDRITWGQLVSHGIASHLRFAYNVTGKPANGLYVLQDRATLVVEPAMLLSDIPTRVPPSLRGPRYQSYVVAPAKDRNDMPTYLLEEWVGFTNGSEVAIDLAKQGLWGTTVRDGVGGTLELTLYALAFGLAAEQIDPTYFTQNPLTREFLAWNIERAMLLHGEGSKIPVFANAAQNDLLGQWKAAPDAAPLRNFARRLFGGPYSVKVLGIAAPKE